MAARQDDRTNHSGQDSGLAYHGLSEVTARVFRLLPIHPGPDASTAAVAALAALTIGETRDTLTSLSLAHLVELVPVSSERWRMRDSARRYAQRLSDAQPTIDEHEQGIDRLLCYYQTAAEAADDQLRGLPPIPVPQEFSDRGSALTWMDAERASLMASIRMAAASGRDRVAASLPLLIAYYLNFRELFDDMLALTTISLGAARRLGDRAIESEALSNLGAALIGLRRYDEALIAHQEAAVIFRRGGDRHAQAELATNLGVTLSGLRRYDEALIAHQEAAAIFRQEGDRHAEGTARNNLGIVLRALGRNDEACAAYQDAVAFFRDTGNRHDLALALGNLGNVLRSLKRSAEAIDIYREAVSIYRETGDRPRELATLENLTAVQGNL